jgi:hypothetical protein
MSRRKIWLWGLLAVVLVITALSQVRWDLLKRSGRGPDWVKMQVISKDPAFLYLTFIKKGDPAAVTSWLHPTERRSGEYQEGFMPGHEKDSHAFVFELVRESPDGYEVAFHPVDPLNRQPLSAGETRLFFARSTHEPMPLTDKLSVAGFYGNPQQKPPG